MSVDATRWAWQQRCKASAKIVLLSLADRADEFHRCFPSVQRLSEDTGLDRKTVMAKIAELEQSGLISVSRHHGGGNIYTLSGVSDRHETSTKTGTTSSTKNGTGPKNGTGTKNGTRPVPKTGLDQYQKRDTNLSITNQEPKSTQKRPARKTTKTLSAADLISFGVDEQTAADWLEVRAKKRAPLTKTAWAGMEREAGKAGITVAEAVRISAERGWQSFNAAWDWRSSAPQCADPYTVGDLP